jgi:hypothetical protein
MLDICNRDNDLITGAAFLRPLNLKVGPPN